MLSVNGELSYDVALYISAIWMKWASQLPFFVISNPKSTAGSFVLLPCMVFTLSQLPKIMNISGMSTQTPFTLGRKCPN